MIKSILLIDEDPLTLFISRKIIEIALPHVVIVACTSIAELPLLFKDYRHYDNHPDLVFASFNRPASYNTDYLILLSTIGSHTKVVALGMFLENDIELFKKYHIQDYVRVPLSVNKIENIVNSTLPRL